MEFESKSLCKFVLKGLKQVVIDKELARSTHPLLKKYSIVECHLPIMERQNFWKIAPEEGKYSMAVHYHRLRQMALLFTILKLNKDGLF